MSYRECSTTFTVRWQAQSTRLVSLCDVVQVLPELGLVLAVVLRAAHQDFSGYRRCQSPALDDSLQTQVNTHTRTHARTHTAQAKHSATGTKHPQKHMQA